MAVVKVITFDLDNTLWDVGPVIHRAEARMRGWLAETVPEYDKHIGPDRVSALRQEIIEEQPRLRHDLSELREEVLFRAIRDCGYAEARARETAAAAFQLFFKARHDVEYFEDALETLSLLSQDFVLGALTNGNADFRLLRLDSFFSFGFSAAGVGASKPAPDMFQAALSHTGTKPNEVIHVGDHLIDDIQGATQVGMHTIWVNHEGATPAKDSAQPTDTIQSLKQLPDAIRRISVHHD